MNAAGGERPLLEAVAAGSRAAFAELVDRHQQAVRAFLRRVCIESQDIDDIAQEAFLVAWSQAGRYRGQASERTWLCAIAWRKARDAARSAGRRRQRDTHFAEVATAERGDTVGAEDRMAVLDALAGLPLDQRAALALCLGGDFTIAEAAEVLSLPRGTVASHLSRGRAKLLIALGETP